MHAPCDSRLLLPTNAEMMNIKLLHTKNMSEYVILQEVDNDIKGCE